MKVVSRECVFCQILAGQKHQPIIYQDALCTAFMDINQPNPYHTLIVPNDHVESVYDLRPEQAAAIFQASVSICRAIRDASNCAGIHQIGNNGRAAGQTVFHFHLHLMPRFTGDLAKMALYLFGRKSIKTDVVLDQMANDLRAKLTR